MSLVTYRSFRFVAPYDLIKHTDNTFYEKLRSSKWSDRKDAIQELLDIAEKNPIFVPNEDELQNLIKELSKVSEAFQQHRRRDVSDYVNFVDSGQ